MAFGWGGASERTLNGSVGQMANPIFNDSLGVDPRLVGAVLAISRLGEALLGPFVGHLSDKTRSRFGRRTPWLIAGGILSAIFFALMWMAPAGMSQQFYAVWFLGTCLLLYLSNSLYSIPYDALGMEMSSDYQGRTSVMAYRAALAKVGGLLVASLYWFIALPMFDNPVEGMRYAGFLFAFLILAMALGPCFVASEKGKLLKPIKKRRFEILIAARETLQNRYFALVVSANSILIVGTTMVAPLGYYTIIYHVYGGEKSSASGMILSMAGYAAIGGSLLGIPTMVRLSKLLGKKKTLILALVIALIGNLLKWPCYTPVLPVLVLIPDLIQAFAFTSIWNLQRAMIPDVVDLEEQRTGERREGMFGGVFGLTIRVGSAVALVISGFVLDLSGFDASLGGNQSEGTVTWIRIIYTVVPSVAILVAILVLSRFDLSEEKVKRIQNGLGD